MPNDIETIDKSTITTSQLARLWDLGLDTTDSSSSRPTRPAEQIEWVYACLMMIIRTCRDIQLVLSTTGDKVVESGPAYEFLFNNPDQPYMDFMSDTLGYLSLHNEVYWITIDSDGLRPKRLLVAGRDTCKPVLRRGVLVGYDLKAPEGRRIPLFLEDVYPLIDFNPYSQYHGIGPLDSAKLAISTSYQATLLNEATLANGARIGVILTVPPGVKMDPDEKAAMKAEFSARHGGARNAGMAFLATGGVDVKPFTQTMADLQMLDLRRFDAASICAAFAVPPELVGLNPEAQYAHGPAQQRFVENTVSPMLSYLSYHITLGILRRFRFDSKSRAVPIDKSMTFCGSRLPLRLRSCYRREKVKAIQSAASLFAWFDTSQHPAMQAKQQSTAESVLKFTNLGVPLNDLIEAHDLPYQTQAWGNDWWISMGQVPARYALEAGVEGLTGPSLPEEPEPAEGGKAIDNVTPDYLSASKAPCKAANEAHRLRIWRNWVTSWLGIEREYTESMRAFFVRQQLVLIRKLRPALKENRNLRASKAPADDIVARVVFDLRIQNTKLQVINQTFFKKASELGVRQSLTEVLGLTGDALAEFAESVKAKPAIKRKMLISSRKIVGVNKTTQDMVANQLRSGLEAGEGLAELTARIKKTLGGNLQRAQRIARTQTGGAVGTGRHEGFRAAGMELKVWLSSRDDTVRDSHRAAESRYADGIAIDSHFEVGGDYLMYPGDPAGSAAQIINCRCVELVKRAAAKTFDLTYYAALAFYTYSDMQKAKAG